jgi:hypothetical protein
MNNNPIITITFKQGTDLRKNRVLVLPRINHHHCFSKTDRNRTRNGGFVAYPTGVNRES